VGNRTPSILHLSDLHFGREHAPARIPHFIEFLPTVCSPDVIVASGDFCFNAEEKSFIRAKEFLLQTAALVSVPENRVFVVPGNHDIGRARHFLSPKWARQNFDRHLGQFARLNEWLHFPDSNLSLYLFDSNAFDLVDRALSLPLGGASRAFAGGKIGRTALAGLRSQYSELLRGSSRHKLDTFKVAVLHHHVLPLPIIGEALLAVTLDAGDLLSCLDACDFDLVLHGHQHHPFFAEVKFSPLWSDGSGGAKQAGLFVAGAGSLCKNEKNAAHPNQFSILEFDAADSRRTEIVLRSFIHTFERWREDNDGRKRATSRKEHREGFVISPATLKRIADQIGYKRRLNDIDIKVEADGSALHTFRVIYESRITKLSQVHLKLDSEAKAKKTVRLQVLDKQCEDIEIDPSPDDDGFVYVYFRPCLGLGRAVEFRVTVNCAPGTYLWNPELLEAQRQQGSQLVGMPSQALAGREYFSHMVTIPTDELRISIQLNPSSGVRVSPEISVWLDEEAAEHRVETRRVRDLTASPSDGRTSFTVPRPVFGAKYIWSWAIR
jgi:predicted phosphodiesterase